MVNSTATPLMVNPNADVGYWTRKSDDGVIDSVLGYFPLAEPVYNGVAEIPVYFMTHDDFLRDLNDGGSASHMIKLKVCMLLSVC